MSSNAQKGKPASAGGAAITVRTAAGIRFELTLDEYRLALLGLVDFDSAWDALELATTLVADGPAKAAILRDRLLPIASHLPALLVRGVDSLELLAARRWFREGVKESLP
jgi:hypothetical protein